MSSKSSQPLEYWRLERWPFPATPGEGLMYPSAGHTEALARVDYLVEARRRLGVLLGEPGIGKSVVLQAAARQLARQGRAVVLVDALGVSTREMVWQIAAGLGSAPADEADLVRLWRLVGDRVVENRWQQTSTVLLVDDAGQAGPDAIIQLTRLARLDASPAARWTIVLASERGQTVRWGETLRGLVDLRIELSPWDELDAIGYVQTALVEAGREEPLFEDDALAALYEISGGIPRQLTRLADFALLAAAAAGLDRIDAATVHEASAEVCWHVPVRMV